jgi:hypothetical protein
VKRRPGGHLSVQNCFESPANVLNYVQKVLTTNKGQGAPCVIHSNKGLDEYTDALFDLTSNLGQTPVVEEAIELLTLLIDRYEREHCQIPDADPVDVLKSLLGRNNFLHTAQHRSRAWERKLRFSDSVRQAQIEPRAHRTAQLALSSFAFCLFLHRRLISHGQPNARNHRFPFARTNGLPFNHLTPTP